MIVLARHTGSVELDVGAEALCVRHPDYDPPRTAPGCRHLTFKEFAAAPRAHLAGRRVMVVVGINRLITPANRTKVGPLLLRPVAGLRRISVDRTLFVSEPWRAWFHFGCVGAPYREYTYSFLAESHWKAAQEGQREDPFSLDAITDAGAGVIDAREGAFFGRFEVERRPVAPEVHAAYAAEKARAFDEEHTLAAIVTRLARVAREALPSRAIPTPAQLYEAHAHRVVQTDLAVDDFLVGRLRALAALTDAIHGRFCRGGG